VICHCLSGDQVVALLVILIALGFILFSFLSR
jgi:hypothetical protein